MLALSNKKSTFALVSGFFGCCIFTTLFNYHLKGRFLTKKALKTNIISEGPVKLIKQVKIAHSFLKSVSNQFHVTILNFPM